MNKLKNIATLIICMIMALPALAGGAHAEDTEKVDAGSIVMHHIGDSYSWHIITVGEANVSIYLPVIVKTGDGWKCFSSSRLYPEGTVYDGLSIATEGQYEGKLVEHEADGSIIRPLDLSLTKNAASLLIASTLLVVIFLYCARWYKKRDVQSEAPHGFVGFMEMFVEMVEDDIVKECVGPEYKKFSPYLLTAFFFILFNNLLGLLPIFPGGANVTGNIAITFVLAMCTLIAINVFGSKHYWKDILWPDVPTWLKFPIPLMPAIEAMGILTKPFALMIRLFANITAGHAVTIALTSIIFVTASQGVVVNSGMTVVSILFVIFMDCMELLVAFIQAYVFTMLSAVFIGMARTPQETE